MSRPAILIGPVRLLRRLEHQLDALDDRPVTLGWIESDDDPGAGAPEAGDAPILGALADLEAIAARRRPPLALIAMPSAMTGLIASVRTRLRKLGIADRFMPTLEDQLAGVGPRTELDIDHAQLLDRVPRPVDERAVRAVVEGKRVLITGAGGSIGGELARITARCDPQRLVLMDRAENALFEIDRQIARSTPTLDRHAMLHDVVDADETLACCRRHRPHVILHSAAHKHVPMMEDHPGAAVDNNLFGTVAIADAADAAGVERFVMISTDKAVNPVSVMGATKRLAELYVQDISRRSLTAFSMVRFGNVLGSSGSVLGIWSRQIADGGPLTVTDPAMTRYFMTIPEAAGLVLESASLLEPGSEARGEVFLLDMGAPVRIMDMARRFVDLHGVDIPIVTTGARPGEKLHEDLAYDAECMQPTRHRGINIWRVPVPEPARVDMILETLDPAVRTTDPAGLAATVLALADGSAAPVAA